MDDSIDISNEMDGIKKWCSDPQKLSEYEKSIRQAKEHNSDADKFLTTADSIPESLWNQIHEAINNDCATSVAWAVNKLFIIYKRIQSDEEIQLPSLKNKLDKGNIEEIYCSEFSHSVFNDVVNKYRMKVDF